MQTSPSPRFSPPSGRSSGPAGAARAPRRSPLRRLGVGLLSAAVVAGSAVVGPVLGLGVPSAEAAAPGLSVDRQVVGRQSTMSSTLRSPALSTSASNELLVAFVASSGPAGHKQSISRVSGGGLTWKLRQRSNAHRGTSEIWQAVAPRPLHGVVVSARRAGNASTGSIVVTAFRGADTGTGAVRAASGSTGAPRVSLRATRSGSWVWAVGNDGTRSVARRLGSGQTKVAEHRTSTRTYWVQRQQKPSAVAGATTTLNATAPDRDSWNLAAVEIRPAKTASTSGSTSGGATATSGTAAGFAPGNPSGTVSVPSGMGAEDTSRPDRVVGTGTAASCTSAALVSAVAAGGVITFSCGSTPVTITLTQTLKVRNSTSRLVLDGGGLVTLSGAGVRRILYIDTCDTSLGSVSGNCLYAPAGPKVTVQNLTFADGNATSSTYVSPGDTNGGSNGGGAIFALGGRLKVVRSVFVRNQCKNTGPDLGGGAIRVLAQHSSTPNDLDASWAARNQDPVVITQSTFGGADGQGNRCSNGGAVSGLRTPITMINSLVSYNQAIGCCANPAKPNTPGGGSGGAVYTDGTSYDLKISGSRIERNQAKAGGSAVFYVSNDRTGHLSIRDSVSQSNTYTRYTSGGSSTDQHFQNYPGIFYLGSGSPDFTSSTIS